MDDTTSSNSLPYLQYYIYVLFEKILAVALRGGISRGRPLIVGSYNEVYQGQQLVSVSGYYVGHNVYC